MNPISIQAILTALSTGAEKAPIVISFIENTVSAVENRSLSGADKLTAVLNATEAFVAGLVPTLATTMETFMAAISAFVAELVALYNAAGIFIHAIKAI